MKKVLVFGIGNWINIIKSAMERHYPSVRVVIVGTVAFQQHKDDFDILILDDGYNSLWGSGWKMLETLSEEQKQKTIIHSWEEDFVREAKKKGISRRIDFRGQRCSRLDHYVLETLGLTFETTQ